MAISPGPPECEPPSLDTTISICSPPAEPPFIPEKDTQVSAQKQTSCLAVPEATDFMAQTSDASQNGVRSVRFSTHCESVTVDQFTLPGQMALDQTVMEPIRGGASTDSLDPDAQGGGLFSEIRDLKSASFRRGVRLTVADLYYKQDDSKLVKLASSRRFEYLTLTVISLNGMWIGIDTDHNTDSTTWPMMVFLVADNFFCVYFTAEVIIRFLAFARKLDCLKDGWFKFDSVLVTLMVGETWVMPFVGGASGGMGNLSILRLLRLLRLTRMAKLMQAVPELLTLVKGIVASIRSVGSTLALLIVFIYVFSIIFTGQYKESEDEVLRAYFGNMSLSMFTLFINGTILDDLSTVCAALLADSQVMLWVLILFILLSSFTMLNMLIGILCEVVSATAVYERNKMAITEVEDVLSKFFTEIDADGSGKISQEEWEQMVHNERVLKALQGLGIEAEHIKLVANVIFSTDDADEERELNFDDFIEELLRIKPTAEANSLEALYYGKVVRSQSMRLHGKLDDLFEELDSRTASLSYAGPPLPLNGEKGEIVKNKHGQKLQQEQKPRKVQRMNLGRFTNEDIIEELRNRGRMSEKKNSRESERENSGECKSPRSLSKMSFATTSDVKIRNDNQELTGVTLPQLPESIE